MKTLISFTYILCCLLLLYSCNNGRWRCTTSGSYKVICINSTDTISYYVQSFLGQNIEAKEYYENNGYVCFESPYPDGAPTTMENRALSKQQVKELEKMGYKCESIGP